MSDKPTLTVIAVDEASAAARLAVSRAALRSWRSQRTGPPFAKLGRRVVYPLAGLQEFLERNTVSETPEGRRR